MGVGGERTSPDGEAIATVARSYSAVAERGETPAEAWLTIGGRRIAVHSAALHAPAVGDEFRLWLRFDKVVARVIGRLRDALGEAVPEGVAVLFTLTAPIRLAARTAEALTAEIRAVVARSTADIDWAGEILGNQIRIRLVSTRAQLCSPIIGFVHNPETDPEVLLGMGSALLQSVGELDFALSSSDEHWLALTAGDASPKVGVWRQIWAALGVRTGYSKILIVSESGRLDILAD